MTNSSPWYRWSIEIDGLPIHSMMIFHGYVSHNQMVEHSQLTGLHDACDLRHGRGSLRGSSATEAWGASRDLSLSSDVGSFRMAGGTPNGQQT